MNQPNPPSPRWMRVTLKLAGLYNLLWGSFVVLFPLAPFAWAGMEPPNYPELWQCIGMIVGVYGIGYYVAAFNPVRHWPIVLVGFLGKIFGPIGFLQAVLTERLPWTAGLVIVTNDLIWWVPFGLILWHAYRQGIEEPGAFPPEEDFSRQVQTVRSQDGQSLLDLSQQSPTMVVFLRHFG